MKKIVSLVKCEEYNLEIVEESIRSALEPFGGISTFVKPGSRVLLKVNMLWGASPKACVTTHPVIVEALIRLVKECDAIPFIADSPGGYPYIPMTLKRFYSECGFQEVADRYGVECNLDTSVENVSIPDALLLKRTNIIKPALETDVIINLPKLKTHGYTLMTCAIKNLFGLVPGLEKAGFHSKLKQVDNFSKMLLDIDGFVKSSLTITDAVMGMEGDGPSGGEPRKIGVIITGIDNLSVDTAAAWIIGLDPVRVPTIAAAVGEGLITGKIDDLEIVGESIESVRVKDYKLPPTAWGRGTGFDRYLVPLRAIFKDAFTDMLTVKPLINREKCVGCGVCKMSCPEDAITIENGLAVIKYDQCIRCYCCHEMCPHRAVDMKQSFLNKLMRKISP
jgi:uncharacterized protein (DUF362 family)/ferredoxin